MKVGAERCVILLAFAEMRRNLPVETLGVDITVQPAAPAILHLNRHLLH